jgi:hypothetical protein
MKNAVRRVTKQVLMEELLDVKTMSYRNRGDYGSGVTPSVGQVAVKKTTDQIIAATSEPADTRGISSLPRGGLLR